MVSDVKKIILDTGITRNPDEYMYDILWGVSDSRIVRDEEGVEEREEEVKEKKEEREKEEREKREKEKREKREKEEREKREKEREEREERARLNKYENMKTDEIKKRLGVLQKITQPTEEENKELTSLFAIFSTRLLTLARYSF